MDTWLIVVGATLAALLVLLFLPLSLRLSFQGRGDPSGTWAVAGGAALGPLAVSAVAARGLTARVHLHFFGREVYARAVRSGRRDDSEQAASDGESQASWSERVLEAAGRLDRGAGRVGRWFNPVDLVSFLLRERRRVALRALDVELEYSFRDIALTGKVYGALCAVSPLLPRVVRIHQAPSWTLEDRASLSATGRVVSWPGLLLLDIVRFVVFNAKVIRRSRGATRTTAGQRTALADARDPNR